MTIEQIIIFVILVILVILFGKMVSYRQEIKRLKKLIYKICGEEVSDDNDSASYF